METETEISSADEGEAMQIDEAQASQDWHDQYLGWINRGALPSDRVQARCVARRAKSFVVIDRELYKRSPSGVLQRCIPIPEGRELLRDIHAGVCGATHPRGQRVPTGFLRANRGHRCHRDRANM